MLIKVIVTISNLFEQYQFIKENKRIKVKKIAS